MALLFSYGTLQREDVQRATFGRRLQGQSDALPGFAPDTVGPHANAQRTDAPGDRVSGTVFEVTDADLAAADEFERPARYTRVQVRLESGRTSWVYVFAGS